MPFTRPADCAAASARRILTALQAADLPALEDALESSLGLPPTTGVPVGEAERRELLGALVCHLRMALQRVRLGLSRRLEGFETVVSLLAHLARTPPHPLPLHGR